MDAYEVLMEEHGIIWEVLVILKQSVTKDLPNTFYIRILEILSNFADKCHHGKEEIALFPLIKKRDPNQTKNIDDLLAEHQKGRKLLASIRNNVENNETQSKVRDVNSYYKLLTEHIRKENPLFISWFSKLNATDKDVLFEEFEDIEKKVIGIGKHQEYATMIKDLESEVKQG